MKKMKNKIMIAWPTTTYFTLQQMFALNKQIKEITIRVRVSGEISNGKVAEIGFIPGGKGRPQKVFAMTPITQTILDKAKQDGIELIDSAYKIFGGLPVANNSVSHSPILSPSAISK